jgi:DNA (cytosine-5)-methyltransferase 1
VLRVLDLFSGIGGFSLGLERTGGFRTVAFCEIDPYCRAVLAKHWPGVPIHEDVRTLSGAAVHGVDVICGGFPCQDISTAGRGAGLYGERSGLWGQYARIIGEIRPSYIIVENVAALLGRGLGDVLGDLAEIGYDAEWHCIPASAIGAPHRRDRIWIVAYPMREGLHIGERQSRVCSEAESTDGGEASFLGSEARRRETISDSERIGSSGQRESINAIHPKASRIGQAIELVDGRIRDFWRIEPALGRVANGVPRRVDRLSALGNAVVPQIPEIIGRAILQAEREWHV